MAGVRVVTDSTADLDSATAESMGIAVVPIYVRWGTTVFQDGVDLSPAELYRRMEKGRGHPATAQPGPEDFSRVYAAQEDASGIVSVHISSKISGTYNSARLAAESSGTGVPVEVVDTRLNSAGLALVVLAGARVAAAGGSLQDVAAEVRRACGETRMVALFDTMKYLARGGRISPGIAVAAGILRVKPVLTFRDGEIIRAGLARSREEGMRRLLHFMSDLGKVRAVIVSHSSDEKEVQSFIRRVEATCGRQVDRVLDMGAALGVHGGPGTIVVAGRREITA